MKTSILSALTFALVLAASPLAAQGRPGGAARPAKAGISATLKRERRRLHSVREALQKASAYVRKALTTRSTSRSIALFKQAKTQTDLALDRLNRYRLLESKDPVISGLSADMLVSLREKLVETSLHLASAYNVRGSYSKALKWTNAALAVDPKNEQALEQRKLVEKTSAEQNPWWPTYRYRLRPLVPYGYGGGYGGHPGNCWWQPRPYTPLRFERPMFPPLIR